MLENVNVVALFPTASCAAQAQSLNFRRLMGVPLPDCFTVSAVNDGTGAASLSLFLRVLPFHLKELRCAIRAAAVFAGAIRAANAVAHHYGPREARARLTSYQNPPDL